MASNCLSILESHKTLKDAGMEMKTPKVSPDVATSLALEHHTAIHNHLKLRFEKKLLSYLSMELMDKLEEKKERIEEEKKAMKGKKDEKPTTYSMTKIKNICRRAILTALKGDKDLDFSYFKNKIPGVALEVATSQLNEVVAYKQILQQLKEEKKGKGMEKRREDDGDQEKGKGKENGKEKEKEEEEDEEDEEDQDKNKNKNKETGNKRRKKYKEHRRKVQ